MLKATPTNNSQSPIFIYYYHLQRLNINRETKGPHRVYNIAIILYMYLFTHYMNRQHATCSSTPHTMPQYISVIEPSRVFEHLHLIGY